MLRLILTIATLFVTTALAMGQSKGVERLRDVGSVYVQELGQTEKAKTLRQEIIKGLVKSKSITVVDAPDRADAVLSASVRHGSKNIDQTYEVFGEPGMKVGSTVVPTQEIVFSINSRLNLTLWAVKFDYGSFSGKTERQMTSDLANRVSQQFQKAVERDGKRPQ